ncbi:ATP-dependent zinc metalloprotease FtsH [Olea europaea subsp. europaea]|uniref:ATP-dependent zinc metalloprotease FtsH n=1 Tax=Olea europaea subsp. europaea TaxID=158383 RepID=A0A8S0TL90_OLEEU|nr:ATP-dependent zinc metalloprotease FtsH [Olea europaea subsp. europaea]
MEDVSQHCFFEQFGDYMGKKGAHKLDADIIKDVQMLKRGLHTMEFITIYHFVAMVLNISEEDKQLVAYLDDIYEDSRGDKMVVRYEKVLKKATTLLSVPFVCYRQFDNDDIKAFDITRV